MRGHGNTNNLFRKHKIFSIRNVMLLSQGKDASEIEPFVCLEVVLIYLTRQVEKNMI